MKILLTGGEGFVATFLELKLESLGYDVTNVSRSTNPSYQEILVSNESFNYYIHTAGLSKDSPNADLGAYFDSNVELTKQIYSRYESDKQAYRFIFFSSMLVLDNFESVTSYVKSKIVAEKYLLSKDDGGVQIIRPALICSPPLARGLLSTLCKLSNIGLGLSFPKDCGVNWVSIETLVDSILHSLNTDRFEKELLLLDKRAELNFPREWIKDFNNKQPIVVLPVPLIVLVISAYMGDFLNLPFNSYFLKKLRS